MSKKRILPYKMQIKALEKKLKSLSIEPDLVDLEALVDKTLSYKENEKRVLQEVEHLLQKKDKVNLDEVKVAKEFRDYTIQEDIRSEEEWEKDEQTTEKVTTDLDKWIDDPGTYDFPHVDTPETPQEEKKEKKEKKKRGGHKGLYEKIRELYLSGVTSPTAIAKRLGCTRQAVYYHLNKIKKEVDTAKVEIVEGNNAFETKEEFEELIDDIKEEAEKKGHNVTVKEDKSEKKIKYVLVIE